MSLDQFKHVAKMVPTEQPARYPKLFKTLKLRHLQAQQSGDLERLESMEKHIRTLGELHRDLENTKQLVERDKNDEDPTWTQEDYDQDREQLHDEIHSWMPDRENRVAKDPELCDLCEEDQKKTGNFKVI